eukprot:scaffold874_cov380-Prasinococcus_capsulatus_cf.AAC.27
MGLLNTLRWKETRSCTSSPLSRIVFSLGASRAAVDFSTGSPPPSFSSFKSTWSSSPGSTARSAKS